MTATIHPRTLRESPYKADADARRDERAGRAATMPKSIEGLCAWYAEEAWGETPTNLHSSQVWRDQVAPWEDVKPVGASDSGALAYADEFRRRLENSPTEVDHRDTGADGRVPYLRPISATIKRLSRKTAPKGGPLMAFRLLALANYGFDWRRQADALARTHEEHHVYLFQALVALWLEHDPWVRSD